jgi:hypothetical protein
MSWGQSSIVASYQGVTGYSVLTVPEPSLVTLKSATLVFGKRHMVSQIRLALSGAANSADAQTLGMFHVATPGKKGSFTAKNAGAIRLRSAVYDSVHNVVLLTPTKAFAQTKPLQVMLSGSLSGGLHDSLGRLIDGDKNGIAGGNAVVVIPKGAATASV